MLKPDITKEPTAVELLFCKPFGQLAKHEMNKEDTEDLIRLMLAKPTSLKDAPIKEEEKPFVYKLIEKRVEHTFTFRINDSRLVLFLAIICKSAGDAVMYLAYLQYWCKQNNVKELDLDTFGKRIFPFGFPNDEDMSALWRQVKVDYSYSRQKNEARDMADKYSQKHRVQKPRKYWRLLRNLNKKTYNRFGSDNLLDYQTAYKSIQFN